MFLEYFIRAREYLSQQGLNPTLAMGAPVSESDLNALDNEMDFPMPRELRQFYLQVGDGFAFLPDGSDSKLVGWEHTHLADHKIWNNGFSSAIQEVAQREISNPTPRSNLELLNQETVRRKRWMPFYGFVGGGDVLCLDLGMNPPGVRFHKALFWVALADTWDFLLAASFPEFVECWSRFSFISPNGGWTSYCQERSGRFDWSSEHFPQIAKGRKTGRT
jgi:hypothetical protein